MSSPSCPLILERRVEFSQTDAAGIIHFSTYFTLMEAAEAQLFRALDLSLLWQEDGGSFGFPRTDCQCRFRRPLMFDEKVRVQLEIEEIESSRIRYRFVFFNDKGHRCANGSMVTTCARRGPDGELTGVELPEKVRTKLANWKNQTC